MCIEALPPEQIRCELATQAILVRIASDEDGVGHKTGSLYRNWNDQNVPNVNWNDGKLYVNWYNRDNANGNLRSREVVV